MGWEQFGEGIHLPFDPDIAIPELREVTIELPSPPAVTDVEMAAAEAVTGRFAGIVTSGMTVAVGAGSRGLAQRVELLRGAITGLRGLGAEPFVVPAMGSHGGATAVGQRAMLENLGITETSVGAEIRSSVDTVVVATTDDGMPLHLDVHAAGADRILPVNRIKPHTCFRGPIESGLTKMAVVGFGKQPGAAQIHSCGPVQMRDRLLAGIAALRATGRLLGGLGSIESATGHVAQVHALGPDDMGGDAERELTEHARTLVPPLPFGRIDVLIVEWGGKDISGTTLDPNVTGRFWVKDLADAAAPDVATIVLLGITPVSAGNALGIGFADFIPADVAAGIDWAKTYVNCFTAGPAGLRRARMPMVLPDEESCIKAALSMCGQGVETPKRVVRIESTLHIARCHVSEAILNDLPPSVSVDSVAIGE
ncbi:lactate racemase domain-containing protein [soil metagenome]